MADFGISADNRHLKGEFMNTKHLRISAVVISYLVFFDIWLGIQKKQANMYRSNSSFCLGFDYMDFIIYTEKVVCIL